MNVTLFETFDLQCHNFDREGIKPTCSHPLLVLLNHYIDIDQFDNFNGEKRLYIDIFVNYI